uniref:hypothetical protein n=1 Tax=Candidatus Electrothrix sp. TaxID=2170559 RepID=UPI00405666D2
MQVDWKKNMGKCAAAILLTGCYMVATAYVTMAEVPKVQIDMEKIKQALNKQAASGNGTTAPVSTMNAGQVSAKPAASTGQNMQGESTSMGSSGSIGSMGSTGNVTQPMPAQQVLDASMKDAIVGSDIMSEVQQKVMAENMKTIMKSMQGSMMKSMMGSVQGAMQGSGQGTVEK